MNLFAEMAQAEQQAVVWVMGLYRWRCELPVPSSRLGMRVASEYSIVPGEWRSKPRVIKATVRVGRPFGSVIDSRRHAAVEMLINDSCEMPLGHELLIEAFDLAKSSPRSALLLSVAALEVGLKELVRRLVPGVAKLITDLPSPSIMTFFQDLPTLPRRGTMSDNANEGVSEYVMEEMKKAVKLRNELVHQGKATIGIDWLADWLDLCHDLLYLLDFYAGFSWAQDNLSADQIRLLTADKKYTNPSKAVAELKVI